MIRHGFATILLMLGAASAANAQGGSVAFPAGTNLQIRFLHRIESGRDAVGALIITQTMEPLAWNGCVAAPAYSQLAGHIAESRSGGRFGRRGHVDIVFDSLRTATGDWLRAPGVIDETEYALNTRHSSVIRRISTAGAIGVATATGLDEIPGAILGVLWAVRHGARSQILAGEVGRVRFERTVSVASSLCGAAAPPAVGPMPKLPDFLPRTTNRRGDAPGDPINFVMLGTRAELDSAFASAGWLQSQSRKPVHLAEAVLAVIAKVYASHPAVSNQYFEGRAQDVTYELEGPNARYRHHIRLWQLKQYGLPDVWVGSASHDAGIFLKGATHRVDPEIDQERDLVVTELEGGGKARMEGLVALPGAIQAGRLAHGQRFESDGRAAVVLVNGPAFPLSSWPI